MKINRRDFFGKAAGAVAVISVPGVLASFLQSCQKSNNPVSASSPGVSDLKVINASVKNGAVTLKIDSSSPLANDGSMALVNISETVLIVENLGGNSFRAISAICTHQGCTVSLYDSNSGDFVCPCHYSKFNKSGRVVQGPANAPLREYNTNFADGQLSIQV